MSYRHTHVTQFIYADTESISRFVDVLRQHFQWVYPLPDDAAPQWVTFMGKDHDGVRSEAEMEDVLGELEGILPNDVEIVSAWEDEDANSPRQRVWLVRGPLGPPPFGSH